MSKRFTHNGENYLVGDEVECEVQWKDGRKTVMKGKLITIVGDEVFIEADVGPVVGNLSTLERA